MNEAQGASAVGGRAARLAAASALAAGFALACLAGNIAAYLVMILLVVGAVVGFDAGALGAAVRDRAVQMLLVAFLLIAVAFSLSARSPADAAYIADFLPLVLVVPAAMLFARGEPRRLAEHVARFAALGAFVALGTGLFQAFVEGNPRPSGIENSPIHFAALALVLGVIGGSGAAYGTRSAWTILYWAAPLAGIAAALLSGSRGAVIVAVLLIAMLVVFALPVVRRRRRLALGVALAVAGIAGLAVLALVSGAVSLRAFRGWEAFSQLMSGEEVDDRSIGARFDLYASGMRAFFDSPLFGHGWHVQVEAARPYMEVETLEQFERENWGYIHNEPLGLAIAAGVPGVIAYGLVMLAPLVAANAAGRLMASSWPLFIAASLVTGLFAAGLSDNLFMSELSKTLLMLVTGAFAGTALAARGRA